MILSFTEGMDFLSGRLRPEPRYMDGARLIINVHQATAMNSQCRNSLPLLVGHRAVFDTLHVDGATLEYVNSFKYFAVILSTNSGNFAKHVINRVRQCDGCEYGNTYALRTFLQALV